MKTTTIILILLISLVKFSFSQDEVKFDSIHASYNYTSDYHTYIYSKPNSHSLKKKKFNRFSRGYFKYIGRSKKWFKVKFLNKEKMEIGYVLRKKLFQKKFYIRDYFSIHYSDRLFTIRKYKEDKIYDSLPAMNLHHGERVKELNYGAGLMNVKKMIRLQTYRESCPGLTSNNYIVATNNNKLIHVISETSTGEAGWNETELVYLPVKFGNGTIQMINYGYDGKIINYETGEIQKYINPKQFGIPLNQLILKIKINTEPVLDENEEPVLDNNNVEKLISFKKLEIYKWNGKTAKLIKTKILKK